MTYKLLLIFVNKLNLKKLLIRNYNGNNLDNFDAILNIIKDFIKENSNLEYFAYNAIGGITKSDIHYKSYKSLENLVNEIQPFVKMVKYDDLVVKVSDIGGI